MVSKFALVAVSSLALASAQGAAAQAPAVTDPIAAMFGARPSAIGVDLSPNGKLVSYVAPASGGGSVAFTADVQSGESKPFLNSGKGPERLRWCHFVTDRRLICRYVANVVRADGVLVGFSRLVAVNSDGSDLKELGQPSSFFDADIRQNDGSILDWLPGQDGSILMERDYVREAGTTGTRMVRTRNGIGVDRLDTVTLKSTVIEEPHADVDGYMTDGRGSVRLMERVAAKEGLLTGKSQYFYRTANTRDWKALTEWVDGDTFEPLGIDATTDSLYALKPLNGRKALYRIHLTATPSTELVASNPRVDIGGIIRSANGQRVIGYTFVVDKRTAEYFDPEYKALVSSLAGAIPNLPIINVERTSADGSKVLIYAGSDNDPGRYFVFDKARRNLAEIMLVRPELENRKLATVQSIFVKSADGVMIPSYLTLPPGKEPKNLPAVILPHGGPSDRDEWGFDWLAQYIAAKGYAVLQPEYRGSSGFGDAWLMKNGFKSWRTSIGDITASARWLASQGIADPKRLAIVGWSYGGYAALQSASTDPALFKAVAAIAPVTDLAMLTKESEDYTNAEIVAKFIGSGPHIVDGSPLRHATAIKVPVLLVHGDMDMNVHSLESEKMEAALHAAGTPVEFLRFKTLDHQLEDGAARTQMLTKIGELLDRTIGH
ncbi:MAG TPA: S9 family peptidase [Sphingomicrobium sp.]|nr:S9 family peptidase [Sphingomicrobium sp.]